MSQLPLNDTDFWWVRYVLGIALPIGLLAYGIHSLISGHSFAVALAVRGGYNHQMFIPVLGNEARCMGAGYLGMALALFGQCFAQYQETLGNFYEWIVAAGLVVAAIGVMSCSWLLFVD